MRIKPNLDALSIGFILTLFSILGSGCFTVYVLNEWLSFAPVNKLDEGIPGWEISLAFRKTSSRHGGEEPKEDTEYCFRFQAIPDSLGTPFRLGVNCAVLRTYDPDSALGDVFWRHEFNWKARQPEKTAKDIDGYPSRSYEDYLNSVPHRGCICPAYIWPADREYLCEVYFTLVSDSTGIEKNRVLNWIISFKKDSSYIREGF